MQENRTYDRYQRQSILPGFGAAAQELLQKAKVLVVGAGGLGCPALQYLAAVGVGTLGIIDDDIVDISNLHRQVLYGTPDIGLLKAPIAAAALERLNPSVNYIVYPHRLTVANAYAIVENFDIIIDGTDNFATRYLVNDVCVLLEKPLVYGAVSTYEGQVAIFNQKNGIGVAANYRDLFPKPPAAGSVMNCAEAGVLGVLPGIIGTMQANETIKLITGTGEPLVNQILAFNALNNETFKFDIKPGHQTQSLIPRTRLDFENTDYDWLCGSELKRVEEVDSNAFNALLADGSADVVDVREANEMPTIDEFFHFHIPLDTLEQNLHKINKDIVVSICRTGKRSQHAGNLLLKHFGKSKKIYSLRGGILQWKKEQ